MEGWARGASIATLTGLGSLLIYGCAQVPVGASSAPDAEHTVVASVSAVATSTPTPVPTVRESQQPTELQGASISEAERALFDDLGGIVDDENVAVMADIDGEPSGYAGLAVRPGPDAVDLYWKGAVPHSVMAIIKRHPTVDVTIHPTRWSLNELMAGRDGAWKLLNSRKFKDVELTSIGPQPDASGLLIQLGDVTPAQARRVEAAVAKATGITIFIETGVITSPAIVFDGDGSAAG
jgi:hypothetical protein